MEESRRYNMEPNYVLRFNEAVLMPTAKSNTYRAIKIAIWVIVGIIILASFVFRTSIFHELSGNARWLLVVLAVGTLFVGNGDENVPSPVEFQFYDSCFVLFRPCCYVSRKVTRREINRLKYSEISKVTYKTRSKRLHIYGTVDAKWYKNGVMSEDPTYARIVEDAILIVSTRCTDLDIVSEIENHSPLKVIVENS